MFSEEVCRQRQRLTSPGSDYDPYQPSRKLDKNLIRNPQTCALPSGIRVPATDEIIPFLVIPSRETIIFDGGLASLVSRAPGYNHIRGGGGKATKGKKPFVSHGVTFQGSHPPACLSEFYPS